MLCCSFLASADELGERQLISDRAATLFHSGQFAALEKDATRYRETGARTSSGLWKLTLFYGGLAKIPNEDVTAEEYWKGLEEKAQKWAGAYPNSPTGHLVYAEFLTAHAWMYRGEGWADEVRQEDWKPFKEYYAKARKYLIAHKAIASRDPRWYELMIDIAKAEGWKMNKFNSLVDEATSRYPYFYQIYFAAIDYLTPKWHGSREEIESFAQKAVKITHGIDGEGMYARIYWYASQTNYGEKLFTDSKVVWSKMSKSIDDVLRQYPDQWNINNFAYFSCLAGDAQKTSDLMSRVTGKPILDAWKSMPMYDYCKAWAATNLSGQKRQTGTQI
jgi:hypothetical protein